MGKDLSILFEKYMDECRFVKALRPETLRTYREVFKTFCKYLPELEYAEMVTPELVTLFFKRMETRERIVGKNQKKSGIKPSTIKTYGNNLKSFFEWLVNKGYRESNPFKSLILPIPVYEDHRALKREEVQKIIAAIVTCSVNPLMLRRDLLIVHILAFCGIRKNELISLQVSDVNLQQKLLTIRGETSKSKKTRLLPIHPTLLLHLYEYLKERKSAKKTTPFLLVANTTDSGLTHHGIKHWVQKLVRASKVKFHLHRFRHTFATNLANQDIGAVKIQRLLGHTSLNMTAKYLRSMKSENLSNDIDKLSIENFE